MSERRRPYRVKTRASKQPQSRYAEQRTGHDCTGMTVMAGKLTGKPKKVAVMSYADAMRGLSHARRLLAELTPPPTPEMVSAMKLVSACEKQVERIAHWEDAEFYEGIFAPMIRQRASRA